MYSMSHFKVKKMKKIKTSLIFFLFLLSIFVVVSLGAERFPFLKNGLGPKAVPNSQPVLKVFPIDKHVQFNNASSRLTIQQRKGKSSYNVILRTNSETNSPTFLRQDIALIYTNGVLISILYGWKENLAYFEQNLAIKGEGSARYNVITFHHAEIHNPDNVITSQQAMSHDQAYILSSAFSSLSFFREAQTNTQAQWQRILDHAIKEQWNYQWNYLIQYFKIDPRQYELIPFTQLPIYQTVPLPNFSQAETLQIIGGIWEGVYRHYVLGLTNSLGKPLYPEGSTLPILLLANDGSHLKLLFRSSKGQEVQLIQQISYH